jgi:FAD/FMN-containing dehydrogenase
MLKPSTTEQVSEILKHCNDRSLAVVPQGGNTSLVGGSVPVFDEIILNMGNMNKILNFDSSYGILSSEAGCILQDLQAHAQGHNTEFPIDLGAKGSCMIGGNLSTNAGGINFIKHNSLHANCIGLKAVLPNGDILDNMTTLRKDNTGYDLKQLFIGAEGTLGIITECAILCGPQAKNKNMVLLSCRTFEDVLKIQKKAKADLSDILRAFEFMDWESVDIVVTQSKKSNYPFTVPYKFFCLVETASSGSLAVKEGEQPRDPDLERLFNFIESVGDSIIVSLNFYFRTAWSRKTPSKRR